ncbi:short-chain dehydrogenases/reductase, putative [Rhizophagus clarus]|nr:short-chain dehydrogenases/reductase, putative [Rhizophagus clarus]
MSANVNPHFIMYRNFIPLLLNRPGSSYTLVTGASGLIDEIGPQKIPSGITGITQTVLYGISRVGRYETRNSAVRFNELLISYRIEDDDTYNKLVSEGKISETDKFFTSSSKFGTIFPKIAKSNVKSEVIKIGSATDLEEFEKNQA